ncbi:MAG: gamma-glutamylcyclotransferase family protein [Promethearchaeota archaeon]
MALFVFGYGTFISKNFRRYPIVAEISGYKRIYHPDDLYGLWYPFVLPSQSSRVRGILMYEKDDSLLNYWDHYEGYPELYTRVLVPVEIISDRYDLLNDVDKNNIRAWVYVPSERTESLTLDRIFKRMRRKNKKTYDEMMALDLWLEKLKREDPEIPKLLPELFE